MSPGTGYGSRASTRAPWWITVKRLPVAPFPCRSLFPAGPLRSLQPSDVVPGRGPIGLVDRRGPNVRSTCVLHEIGSMQLRDLLRRGPVEPDLEHPADPVPVHGLVEPPDGGRARTDL